MPICDQCTECAEYDDVDFEVEDDPVWVCRRHKNEIDPQDPSCNNFEPWDGEE